MHVMWNKGKWKSPLFQILALLASRRRSDRPNRVLQALLQFICFLWFYILFLSLFDSSDCTVFTIFFSGTPGNRCLPVIIYICFLDRSNLFIFLCTTIWSWRIKSLAAFRLTFLRISFKAPISLCIDFFWLCRQCPAAAVLQTCLYRISAGWKTNRCRGGFLLHSVNFVNLFTEQTKKHLLILRS